MNRQKNLKQKMTYTLFYLFSGLAIISAIQVIWSKNPVESVLYLVLVFINASGIFLLLEVEYMALIFLIVYVGAIAVLFLFVVIMLAPKIQTNTNSSTEPFFFLILGAIFITEISILIFNNSDSSHILIKYDSTVSTQNWLKVFDGQSNLENLGQVLYTYYFYYFLLAGFVLLVAIIGGIVLTLQTKLQNNSHSESSLSKRQHVFEQLSRNSKEAIFHLKRQ